MGDDNLSRTSSSLHSKHLLDASASFQPRLSTLKALIAPTGIPRAFGKLSRDLRPPDHASATRARAPSTPKALEAAAKALAA